MLEIKNLTYRIAGRAIFDDATATIRNDWKVGIVGANGAGKSTLFKLIAGELGIDSGTIELASRKTMGMIRQDLPTGDIPLMDVVLASDKERATLLEAVETETDPYKLAEIHDRLIEIDAYTGPARAAAILSGMGFSEEQMYAPMSSLSGGWRMRVALGAALFQQPDFLLLDEPTNHLDLEAIMWLEGYLEKYPHTLIVISHDRELLNKCTDHILHLENKKLEMYTGNYDTFEQERIEKRGLQQKMFEKQQVQRAHMQKFVDKFKAKASKAKQAQSRMKALERMELVSAVAADRTVTFRFPQPGELPPPLISIDNVSLGYESSKPILTNINERIDMDDRIALLGANGNGKSTLMKCIAARLKPLNGELHTNNKLRIGYFSQHQTDEMDMNSTAFLEMKKVMKGKEESLIRGKLGMFGFNKQLQDNKISALSGGEKARLTFAMISHDAPHVLLLDEPTNHLDMDSREALVQALTTYEGAVVIVSHDPSMVERVADRLWLVKDGEVSDYEGDLDAYRKLVIESRREEKRAEKPAKEKGDKLSKKEKRALAAAKRKAHALLYQKVQEAEKELKELNAKRRELEVQMAQSTFYDNAANAQKVQAEHANLATAITAAESAWLAAQEVYDAAE